MKEAIKSFAKSIGLYNYYIKKKRQKYAGYAVCTMDFRGLRLKFNTKDVYSKSWFFPRFGYGQIHEPGATNIFIDNINQGANVFDIGGHLGYFSCVAGQLSHNGTVCVFEVDANCIDLIKENVELNHLKNVKIFHSAVSDSSGMVSIPKLELPNPGLRIESSKGSMQIKVPSTTIDEFISQKKVVPDFMKIDVEGAEFKVLKGMENTLKNESLILLIEIHVSQLSKHYNTDYKDVLKLLKENGFKLEKVESHRSNKTGLKELSHTDELSGNVMILCRKQ